MSENEYNYIIPIGCNCEIAAIMNILQLRKYSFPYDWDVY